MSLGSALGHETKGRVTEGEFEASTSCQARYVWPSACPKYSGRTHYNLTGPSSVGYFARDGLDAPNQDVEAGLEACVEVVARALLPQRPEDPPQRRCSLRLRLEARQQFATDVELPGRVRRLAQSEPVDEATLSERMRWVVRLAFPATAILMPLAFFLSVLSPEATEPNAMIYLAYVAGVVLAVGLLGLGVGLVRRPLTLREG